MRTMRDDTSATDEATKAAKKVDVSLLGAVTDPNLGG